MRKRIRNIAIIIVIVMSLGMLTAGCQKDTPTAPYVESVTIANGDFSIVNGDDSVKLNAEVKISGEIDKTVLWSSSNENVMVSDKGLVTPLNEGVAVVRAAAKADKSKFAEITITVTHKFIPHNGSFEKTPHEWGMWSNNATTYETLKVVQDKKHTLNNAMLVSNSGVAGESVGNYTVMWQGVALDIDDADLEIGNYYKLQAYIMTTSEDNLVENVLIAESVTGADVKTNIMVTPKVKPAKANEWTLVQSEAFIVPDANILNFKAEFHGQGSMYIDSIDIVPAVSNNTNLSSVKIDDADLIGFANDTIAYNMVWTKNTMPVITATTSDALSTLEITQVAAVPDVATIKVTAKDGSMKTFSINFKSATVPTITSISIDGAIISEFDLERTHYYKLLDKGTTIVPAITATATSDATIDIVAATSLPGATTVAIGGGAVYDIYFDIVTEDRLTLGYPDTNFDGAGTTVGQNWGFDKASIIASSNIANSGKGVIKTSGYGGGGWMGMDLGGNANGYPEKGNKLKLGAWVYISSLPSAAEKGSILFQIHAKENSGCIKEQNIAITAAMIGKWVYLETDASSVIPQETGYIQIVVKNFTGTSDTDTSEVYFDNITIKKA